MNVSVDISLIPAVFLNVKYLTIPFPRSWKVCANNHQFWFLPTRLARAHNFRSRRSQRLQEQETMTITPESQGVLQLLLGGAPPQTHSPCPSPTFFL